MPALDANCSSNLIARVRRLFETQPARPNGDNYQELALYFGALFYTALSESKYHAFLKAWRKQLEQYLSAQKEKPVPNSLARAFAAKRLISDIKSEVLRHYYSDEPETLFQTIKTLFRRYKKALATTAQINPPQLLRAIHEKNIQLAQRVLRLEDQLRPKDHIQASLVSTGNILGHTLYYQWACDYLNMADEVTTANFLANTTLGTKFSRDYFVIFSALLAMMIAGVEIYLGKWTGLTYSMIHSITSPILSNTAAIVDYCDEIGLDKQRTLNLLPAFRWFFGLALHLAFYALLTTQNDFGWAALSLFYIFATTARVLSKKTFNKIFSIDETNKSLPRENMFRLMFIRGLLMHLVYIVANNYSLSVYARFKLHFLSDESIISSKDLCLEVPDRCKRIALARFQLSPDATENQIRRAWKEASLRFHPDKGGSINRYLFWSTARERLRDLQKASRSLVAEGDSDFTDQPVHAP